MTKKKAFIICPVRNAEPDVKVRLLGIVNDLEKTHEVYYPARDTDQIDSTGGFRICCDNREAIKNSDIVVIVWDGKSQGGLFDMGMAFAFNKKVVVVKDFLPPDNDGKSFVKMLKRWEE